MTTASRFRRLACVVGLVVAAAPLCTAAQPPPVKQPTAPAAAAPSSAEAKATTPAAEPAKSDRTDLEKALERKLSGAVLKGHFTNGTEQEKVDAKQDKYTLSKVTKLAGDYWLFVARIEYGDHDMAMPLPLRVLWAGDTPVITLDQVPVPGLGTFSARVLIHDNEYAGTWSGGKDHGGHLFGTIINQSERRAKAQALKQRQAEAEKKDK